jgi:hypothetical protein
MEQQIHRFTWRGIEIEARYWPLRWGTIAHLEIESINLPRAPLPVSETGYRSYFHEPGSIEHYGGDVVTIMTEWLDALASEPKWQRFLREQEANGQYELF